MLTRSYGYVKTKSTKGDALDAYQGHRGTALSSAEISTMLRRPKDGDIASICVCRLESPLTISGNRSSVG